MSSTVSHLVEITPIDDQTKEKTGIDDALCCYHTVFANTVASIVANKADRRLDSKQFELFRRLGISGPTRLAVTFWYLVSQMRALITLAGEVEV